MTPNIETIIKQHENNPYKLMCVIDSQKNTNYAIQLYDTAQKQGKLRNADHAYLKQYATNPNLRNYVTTNKY